MTISSGVPRRKPAPSNPTRTRGRFGSGSVCHAIDLIGGARAEATLTRGAYLLEGTVECGANAANLVLPGSVLAAALGTSLSVDDIPVLLDFDHDAGTVELTMDDATVGDLADTWLQEENCRMFPSPLSATRSTEGICE